MLEWSRSDRLFLLLTALVASVVAWFGLGLSGVDLTAPLLYNGDALAIAAHFKTAAETGWYESQSLLGAPAGQVYHDFPTADNVHFLAASILGALTGGAWPLAMNLYFFLGFPLAAVASAWFFRKVGLGRGTALALAVVFAIAPYHFQRSISHLWLASYYTIPLAMFLVVEVLRGNPLAAIDRSRSGIRRVLTATNVRTALIVVVTGSAQSYYAVFFLVLLAIAGLYRLVVDRRWRTFWIAAGTGAATAVVMLANMAPDVLYRLAAGANPIGFERSPIESEIFALKLTQLLMPWPGHRIDALQQARLLYDSHYPLISEQPALGAIAAAGLVALFLVLAFTAAAWGRRGAPTPRMVALAHLALLVFVAFLFSTVGGLSTIISFATDALRGWNRMVIVIGLLSLAGIGLVIDAVIARAVRRASRPVLWHRMVAAVAAGALIVVGFVDQTPRDPQATYAPDQARFASDQAWFGKIESALPDGALVLQLPYQPFPEGLSALGILSNEALIPYLNTSTIRWSGGGIKGRPVSDWPMMIERLPPEEIAILAAAAGVDGIHVDFRDLTPARRDELDAGLRGIPGVDVIERDDGTAAFYDLRSLSDLPQELDVDDALATAAGASTVDPVTARANADTPAIVSDDGTQIVWHYVADDDALPPSIVLVSDRASSTRITMQVALRGTWDGDVRLVLPDGTSAELDPDGTTTTVTTTIDPGTTELMITGMTGDFDITQLIVLDDAQLRYLDAVRERIAVVPAW
jgi:hypothetical protein